MNDKGMDVEEDEDARVAIRLLEGDFARFEVINSAVIPAGKVAWRRGGTRPDYAVGRDKAEGKAKRLSAHAIYFGTAFGSKLGASSIQTSIQKSKL